jgi:4,5-dihydroxyphthalate decarboxylase
LFTAFSAAKDAWVDKLNRGEATGESAQRYSVLGKLVGPDPLPYGISRNRATIEALAKTAFAQQLTPRHMSLEETFFDLE